MKKSILNLGKTLSKAEQKQISGGVFTCRVPGIAPYEVFSCVECVNEFNPGGPAGCIGRP